MGFGAHASQWQEPRDSSHHHSRYRRRHSRRRHPACLRSILYDQGLWHRIGIVRCSRHHSGTRRPDRSGERTEERHFLSYSASACPLRLRGGRSMTSHPVCVLYTQDLDLVRKIKAYLRTSAQVRHVANADRLSAVLQQSSPALCIVDLRAKESRDLVEQIQDEWPEVLIIALGTGRSEPLRDAEQSGVYAAEDLQLDRHRFQALVERAFDHLKILQE